MPIVASFGGLSAFGFGAFPGGDFESIATVTVGSGGASSIEFTSIDQSYQHLQVRGMIMNLSGPGSNQWPWYRLNGDTSTNYACHSLHGNGSGVSTPGQAPSFSGIYQQGQTYESTTAPFAIVSDILDYSSTTKNTVVRTLAGQDLNGSGSVTIASGLWLNTAAVTTINFSYASYTIGQYSTLALYGIKAP
jgi:hypothetical protein